MDMKRAKRELEALQLLREKAIREKREILLMCSTAIKGVHKGKVAQAKKALSAVKARMGKLEQKLKRHPKVSQAVLGICYQEYVELAVLLATVGDGKMPVLTVPSHSYILGSLDAIGEMKRVALDLLLAGDYEGALGLYGRMERIFSDCDESAFPSAIAPGLKPKQDAMRRSLEGLHVILVEARLRQPCACD